MSGNGAVTRAPDPGTKHRWNRRRCVLSSPPIPAALLGSREESTDAARTEPNEIRAGRAGFAPERPPSSLPTLIFHQGTGSWPGDLQPQAAHRALPPGLRFLHDRPRRRHHLPPPLPPDAGILSLHLFFGSKQGGTPVSIHAGKAEIAGKDWMDTDSCAMLVACFCGLGLADRGRTRKTSLQPFWRHCRVLNRP